MALKAKKAETLDDQDRVVLKPLWGMKPGKYLAILYGFIVVLVLFFLLIFPGLRNPREVLAFTSEPWGAAIRVDGIFRGAAPCEVSLRPGQHRVEVAMPGFQTEAYDCTLKGRVFGSLFFPKKQKAQISLKALDVEEIFLAGAKDFTRWSFTGEPSAVYQIPRSLSEGAYRAGPGVNADNFPFFGDALRAAARFGTSRAGLRELLRAEFLLGNRGNAASPLSAARSAQDILRLLAETPGSALWLDEAVRSDDGNRTFPTGNAWFRDAYIENAAEAPAPAFAAARAAEFVLEGVRFVPVPRGRAGAAAIGDDFWMAGDEVSLSAWDAFTAARPKWRQENLDALMAEGLVTEDYLAGADLAPNLRSAPGISWYAALDYCAYLTERLRARGGDWSGYEVRLPLEAEWEYAGAYNSAARAGIINLNGSRWEWCMEPYAPNRRISSPLAGRLSSPQRPVRGGAWVNPAGTVTPDTRGALSPETCSPFVGFRPVIVRSSNG
jgi:hypothetical protein